MNIWIINHYAIPPALGGLVRHFYFSKNFVKEGHDVTVFTASKIHNTDINYVKDKSLFIKKSINGQNYVFVRTSDYSKNDIKRIINMIEFPVRMFILCKRFKKPDIIYASSPDIFTAVGAIILSKVFKVKILLEIRDLWPLSIAVYNKEKESSLYISVLYKLEKWVYKNADKLVFTMAGGKQYIIDKKWNKNINMDKIYHINNGIDIEEFEFNKEHYQIDDVDLNDNSSFKIIYTGSIRRANNLGVLLKTAEALKERKYNNIKFIVYGDGTEKIELEDVCNERHIDNIIFKDKVDRKFIPYILSKSDLNLLVSYNSKLWRYGSSINKLFEYAASGKPICTNISMKYSLIQKYNCGKEKSVKTPEEFADMIIEFYEMDKEEYEQQCKNAIKLAKKYDYKVLAKRLLKILENM